MNIPGILSLKTIKASSINLPFLKPGMIIDTITHDDKALIDIPFIDQTCGLKAKEKLTSNGILFEVSVTLRIALEEEDTFDLLADILETPHLFIASDKNGINYLISPNQQSNNKFTFKFKNDADPKGGRSIDVNIYSLTPAFPLYTQ